MRAAALQPRAVVPGAECRVRRDASLAGRRRRAADRATDRTEAIALFQFAARAGCRSRAWRSSWSAVGDRPRRDGPRTRRDSPRSGCRARRKEHWR